jgi:hypothetical protein
MATNEEGIFRAWDFQYSWWRDESTQTIDQCGRAVGKTMSIILRGWAFPLQHPGAEMVVTAPELVHLNPLTARIEDRIKYHRITREMLPKRVGQGFTHRPFQVDFVNNCKILGRIPQRDGKGVKGLHPLRLEMDEAQDFPPQGWIELVETLRHGEEGAQWRAHGVSKGIRDDFYHFSQPGSGWSVHNITGMHRPTWDDLERQAKIRTYGSRTSPDYRRNILGKHGDATNPLFVLHRLMACVDDKMESDYNLDIYQHIRVIDEMLEDGAIEDFLDFNYAHKDWNVTWAGMDVGMTNHPTEILVFGEEKVKAAKEPAVRLLSRIHLERIRSSDQARAVAAIMDFYKCQKFSIDRTGLGLPVYQDVQDEAPKWIDRFVAYAFNEKVVVGWDDHEEYDDPEDFEIKAVVQEYAYDLLRTYVDQKRLIMPFDSEMLGEWQGRTFTNTRGGKAESPYGKKAYNRGEFHTLDAAALALTAKELHTVSVVKEMREDPEIIGIRFA